MLDEAKRIVPVRTGTLKRSLKLHPDFIKRKSGGGSVSRVLIGIDQRTTGVWLGKTIRPRQYGPIVEVRKPYLRPAFDFGKGKVAKLFAKGFKKRLRPTIKKVGKMNTIR
jgi:hypothetical protein